jgi:hypothetical protein
MSFRSDKLALSIDGANLYATVKALGNIGEERGVADGI